MVDIKIRKYQSKDAKTCADIIKTTFIKYNGKDRTKKAVQAYVDRLTPGDDKKLDEIFSSAPFVYVAEYDNNLVGLIKGYPNRIGNLFIDGKYHGKGIGKILVEKFETEVKKLDSEYINIRSSIYAVPFYQKMGYKKTTGIRNFRGLKVQPMMKRL